MDRIFYDNQEYAKYSDKFLKRYNMTQEGYDALSSEIKNDDSKVFFIPDPPEHDYLYKWDFTQSLVDEIQGLEAQLKGGASIDGNGLLFDAGKERVYLGKIDMGGKTIEIDVANFDFKGSNSYHIRFLINCNRTDDLNAYGMGSLIFRAGSGYNYWSCYSWIANTGRSKRGWGNAWSNSWDRNILNGKTVKVKYSADRMEVSLYMNNTLIGTQTGLEYDGRHLFIGGINSGGADQGNQCYDCLITGIRIYENEEEES